MVEIFGIPILYSTTHFIASKMDVGRCSPHVNLFSLLKLRVGRKYSKVNQMIWKKDLCERTATKLAILTMEPAIDKAAEKVNR